MNLIHVTRPELKIRIQFMYDRGRRKYGKKYFRPTLKTQVALLAKYQHIKTSVRTLSRAIRELVDEMVVHRINRHIRGKGIKMVCRATAYYLLDNSMRIFRKMLKQAKSFLEPLGRPKVASDLVNTKRVYSNKDSSVVEILWKSPLKERLKPSEAT